MTKSFTGDSGGVANPLFNRVFSVFQDWANILNNELIERRVTCIIMSNDPFIMRAANILVDLNIKPTPEIRFRKNDNEEIGEPTQLTGE